MKFKITIRAIALTLLFTYAINALAYNIDPLAEACIKKNAPKATVIEKIRLSSEGTMFDVEEVLSAKVYWKHSPDVTSNMLAVFDEPDDIYGSRLLFLEKKSGNEIYLYMPALSKVRRVTYSKRLENNSGNGGCLTVNT